MSYYLGSRERGFKAFTNKAEIHDWLCTLPLGTGRGEPVHTGLTMGATRSGAYRAVPVFQVVVGGEVFWMTLSREWFEQERFTHAPDAAPWKI
jgi:hypothetical protein